MTDPYTYDTAAYALGLLDQPDKTEFEEHLAACAECAAAVADSRGLRSLLSLLPAEEAERLLAESPAAAPPTPRVGPPGAARPGPPAAGRPRLSAVESAPAQPGAAVGPEHRAASRPSGRREPLTVSGLSAVPEPPPGWEPPPAPDSLLPALLWEAQRERRRHRLRRTVGLLVAASLVGLAAVAGAVLARPGNSTAPAAIAAGPTRAFAEIGTDPVRATATVTAASWGTQVQVRCTYTGPVGFVNGYALLARDKAGHTEQIGVWKAVPNQEAVVGGGTDYPPSQLAGLEIRTDSGRTVLRLNL